MSEGSEGAATPDDMIGAVGALAEPNRRALYEHVIAQAGWVTRDEAATAVGLQRGIAAHHLDRLASDGLLEIDYQRRTGRTGPGAGRPAKVYRRAPHDVEVHLPPRTYQLAADLLAEAIETHAGNESMSQSLERVARREGRRLGEAVRAGLGRRQRRGAVRAAMLEELGKRGFEPVITPDGTVVLRNCPFHALARDHTALVCGMNQCLLDEAVTDLGTTGLSARLDPEADLCCVKLEPVPD